MEIVGKRGINKKIVLVIMIVFLILTYIILKLAYSYASNDLSENVIQNIENGTTKITYELFGAKGDGVTNDIEAIRSAHEFANREYIENGILYTVYACDVDDCSDKNYYLGTTEDGGIDIITNVDWRNAHFIVDDYIDDNNDSINEVDIEQSIFNITSPLRIYSKTNNSGLSYLTYNDDVLTKLSSSKTINPDTTNLKELIDALYNREVKTTSFYNNNVSEIEKYYRSSQRWIMFVTNSNKQFIRKGNAKDSGYNQSEIIIIDSNNGDVLTEINWTYDDITEIKVYPVPDNKISIKNGSFTTYTNNVVYTVDENGNSVRSPYSKRNIFINYTGNVEISDIHHYLNEEYHPYTNEYQSSSSGNLYYGFIRIHNAAFVEANNTYLSAHTPTSLVNENGETTAKGGTYDLVIDNSANVFLDNINYACNIYSEDGTKNYSQCYYNNITNESKWGIMASNTSKNIFITNSKMNRIDAHRGVTNLYISDTTIGRTASVSSLTLTGNGYFYGNNLKIDASEYILGLRDDYGSTWDGTMVFDNINYIVNTDSTNPGIIFSNNEENWDFGYTTYFPNVYINGLNIDTTTREANNVTDVTFIRLSNLYNTTTNTSTIDKSNERNLYNFKGNIYLNDLTTNGNKFKLFKYSFVTSSGYTLNKENYGGNNIVDIYLDSDVSVDSKLSTSSNTKFNVVDTMDNKSDEVRNYFEELKIIAKMPESLKSILGKITLSTGEVNEEISDDVTNYTAIVNDDKVTIELETAYIGSKLSWDSKTVKLNYGSNIVEFSITSSIGEIINYTLTIIRPYEFQVDVEGYYYDSINNYLYTKNDIDSSVILNKLNITDVIASIDNGNLILTYNDGEEFASIKIVNFDTDYTISSNNITIGDNVDYESFMDGINTNGVTSRVLDSNGNEIKFGKMVSGYILEIYYDGYLLDTYTVSISDSYETFINYDANGGSNAPLSQKGTSIIITTDIPTKLGYYFVNWNTNRDGSGTSYNSGDKYIGNSEVTLYAQWQVNTYNIDYNLNGGIITDSDLTRNIEYDSIVTINNPSKKVIIHGNENKTAAVIGEDVIIEQKFAGWTSSNIDTNTAYYDDTPWTDGNTKVTATTFKNLTTGNGDTVTMVANWEPVSVILPNITKSGYTCYWNTMSNGKGINYSSGDSYIVDSDDFASINLYAKCIKNSDSDKELNNSPQTGDILIVLGVVIGIISLGFLVYYYSNRKYNK